MPDIGQPHSIKPIWPTRPENQTGRRKRPRKEQEEDAERTTDEEKKREQPQERPGGTPHIDDYA